MFGQEGAEGSKWKPIHFWSVNLDVKLLPLLFWGMSYVYLIDIIAKGRVKTRTQVLDRSAN